MRIKEKNRMIKTLDKSKELYNSTKHNFEELNKNEDNATMYAQNNMKNATIKTLKKIEEESEKIVRKVNNKITEKTVKTIKKKAPKVAKQTKVNVERARQLAIKSTKTAIKVGKVIGKAIVSIIKEIIAFFKSIIGLIASLGSVAVIIIVVICVIALLCLTVFGIFLSNEQTSSNDIKMSDVISECNIELAQKIEEIKSKNSYEEVIINSNRANWNDILLIYTVKISNGLNQKEVMTIDENKKIILKKIFWDMNIITSEVKTSLIDEDMTDKKGIPKKVQKRVLYINIKGKSINEMQQLYSFNLAQINQLNELNQGKYSLLWNSAIYGIGKGDSNVVSIALKEVGNVGGEPYWRWYGFNERVEWCACFVSWVANQAGYIEKNIIPKFAGCETGVNWFKVMKEWREPGYVPKPGDIIFFDWEVDGTVSHVGIVEKVENNKIYTIEGNSTNDDCQERSYSIDNRFIYGFGTPAYN